MITYATCPYEYRNGWKVLLLPWKCKDKEFESVYQGWKAEHFLKNFDKPVTFEFLPDPAWEDGQE